MGRILVTGAFGLVGSELVAALQDRVGLDGVVALGRKTLPEKFEGLLEQGDVRDGEFLEKVVRKHKVRQVYHLAGLLSAGGEHSPDLAWEVNVGGLRGVLDVARENGLTVFWPSSIAAFGPSTPKEQVPQHTVLEPTTMYGVTKVAGELLCQYYFLKWGVDVRSLRYPGLLGFKAEPGDGTTEYAIHMFYGAIGKNYYLSYIDRGTILPMMYMDDAVRGTIQLMEAAADKVKVRTSYNFGALAFAPEALGEELAKRNPNFVLEYAPDERQAIADSWPKTIDDGDARNDWGWSHDFDLPRMVEAMYQGIEKKLEKNSL